MVFSIQALDDCQCIARLMPRASPNEQCKSPRGTSEHVEIGKLAARLRAGHEAQLWFGQSAAHAPRRLSV